MLPRPFRIERRRRDTRDTFTLELRPVDGGDLRPFHVGQFNMIYVFGAGEIPLSISGDPARSGSLIHTTRAVGTVTQALSRMKKGEVVGVRGPFGAGWPIEAAEDMDMVIVAGGIGLAPLRPVIYSVMANRDRFRKVSLLYGTRTPEDILYKSELAAWHRRHKLDVAVIVDRAGEGWRGHVGVVTTLIPRAAFDPAACVAMICGPEVMMRFAILALQSRGVANERIFLSMERNMKCAVGFCGHCQYGPQFICKDGPVLRYDRLEPIFGVPEI